jgi:hypothetical protein
MNISQQAALMLLMGELRGLCASKSELLDFAAAVESTEKQVAPMTETEVADFFDSLPKSTGTPTPKKPWTDVHIRHIER